MPFPAGDMLRRKKGEETKGGGVRQVELELLELYCGVSEEGPRRLHEMKH